MCTVERVEENITLESLVEFKFNGVVSLGDDNYAGICTYAGKRYVFTCTDSTKLGGVCNRTPDNYKQKILEGLVVTSFYEEKEDCLELVKDRNLLFDLVINVAKGF